MKVAKITQRVYSSEISRIRRYVSYIERLRLNTIRMSSLSYYNRHKESDLVSSGKVILCIEAITPGMQRILHERESCRQIYENFRKRYADSVCIAPQRMAQVKTRLAIIDAVFKRWLLHSIQTNPFTMKRLSNRPYDWIIGENWRVFCYYEPRPRRITFKP